MRNTSNKTYYKQSTKADHTFNDIKHFKYPPDFIFFMLARTLCILMRLFVIVQSSLPLLYCRYEVVAPTMHHPIATSLIAGKTNN